MTAPPVAPQAPPAPGAPAPSVAPAAPAAPVGPQPSALDKAMSDARSTLATKGTFATPPAAPAAGAAAPVPPVAAPAAAEPLAAETPPVEGAAPPVEGEAPPPPVEGAAAANELIVELPPRSPGGDPVLIEVSDVATADALRRLNNGYARGEDARAAKAEARQVMQEYEEVQLAMRVDPVGFITDTLSPQQRAMAALSFLTQPDVWAEVKETVLGLGDAATFELVQAKVAATRADEEKKARTQVSQAQAVRKNADAILVTLDRIVPETLNETQREVFLDDAIRDIQSYCTQHKALTLNPRDVPQVIANRLRAYGLDPVAVAAELLKAPAPRPATGARPAAPAAAPAKPKATTITDIQAGAERRAAAAAVAPGGAGGVPAAAALKPPPGSGLKAAVAHARKLGMGAAPK